MISSEASHRRLQTLRNHFAPPPPQQPQPQHHHHHLILDSSTTNRRYYGDGSSNRSSSLIQPQDTCGIIAFVSDNEPSFDYLMDGLTILQNRGYDSAGICTIDERAQEQSQEQYHEGVLVNSKFASRRTTSDALDLLKNHAPSNHLNHRIGIGHTRWATHGAKTDKNAHPHLDHKQRIALVHNGVIENSNELKRMILSSTSSSSSSSSQPIRFESETDTEVIVQLLSLNYDEQVHGVMKQQQQQGNSSVEEKQLIQNQCFMNALVKTLNQLEGTWGLVILTTLYKVMHRGNAVVEGSDRRKTENNEYCLIAVRNGSPMLIGLCANERRMFISSESSAFMTHTREMIALNNGELAIVSSRGIEQLVSYTGGGGSSAVIVGSGGNGDKVMNERIIQMTPSQQASISMGTQLLSPDPYPHWTLKEIMEQAEAVSRSLNFGGRFINDMCVKLGGLDTNAHFLVNIHHLVIAACGTSYYAALYGAKLMRQFKCFHTVRVVDAAELDIDDLQSSFTSFDHETQGSGGMTSGGEGSSGVDTGLLVISQSGETSDVMRCLTLAQQLQIPTFSIVNKVDSLIAKTTSCGVYINAGREHAVASTKAFTCQVTVLSLVTLWFAEKRSSFHASHGPSSNKMMVQMRQQLVSNLHRLPTSIGMLCSDHYQSLRSVCRHIAQHDLLHVKNMFILGKGLAESIALEGALKIKEITYTHAEAYSSGALKHGPFALIEEGTPIFVIVLNDMNLNLNLTAIHEVKARGAHVYAITDLDAQSIEHRLPHPLCHRIIRIPNNGLLTALLAVVPLQLIAYELAVARGIDVDRPRNLAKSVTVL